MAGPSFDQFFYGISQQESGGNYSAVNGSTGALGKYQILPSNIGPWSQRYLGVSWTPQQFLADPTKQDALAKAVLSSYYNQWGARGAASAWYSGNPALANDYGSQNGGPSIGTYVDQVIQKGMGYAGGSVGGSPSVTYSFYGINDTSKNNPAQQPAQAPGDSGMGALSANGTDAVGTTAQMDAVDGSQSGAQAVGATGATPQTPEAQAVAQNNWQAPTKGPGNVYGLSSASIHSRQTVLAAATKWLGTPYVWGGGGTNGPTRSAIAHGNFQDVGFDCSGLVQYALAQAGISAPRLSYDQLAMGVKTPINQLAPGDLVGFGDGSHIAIYLGNNQIVESPQTGQSVQVRTLQPGEDAWGVSLANFYH